MSPFVSRWRVLLVVIALVASWAAVAGQAAVAQTPTELWEEYPLAPETEPTQGGNDGEEQRERGGDGVPAIGDESDAASGDEDPFPLLGIILAFGLVLLVLAFGMGGHPRDWRVPGGLRTRFSAVWKATPRHLLAVANVFPRAASNSRLKAPSGAKRSKGVDVEMKRSRPAKAKSPPSSKKPPPKPAKPAGAAKPQRVPKPAGSLKPSGGGKPPGAFKLQKPAPAAKPRPARVKPPATLQTRRSKRRPGPRTELRPVDEQPPEVVSPLPTGRTVTCSIFGWREGQVADFYAVAFGLQGRDWIVERSPRFFWPAGDVPDEAYEAHAILVDALVRAGWRPTGNEGAWYRQRFERAIETVSERP
jgi:hypothetical protein